MTKHRRTDWPADQETQPVISWTYFFQIWKGEFNHIVVRRPTADICDECYLFYNQVKFRSNTTTSPFVDVDSTDDESENDEQGGDEAKELAASGALKLDWKSQTTIAESDSMETMIEKAGRHVKQARDMHQLLCGKARLAWQYNDIFIKSPVITDEIHSAAIDTVVGDYCQNMGLPHLGEHQPGETYYFSPLTINCFGLANVGREDALLEAYIYHEGEGKKGGNNVASLIMRYLDEQGYINRGMG
jgi:hypothetical protein